MSTLRCVFLICTAFVASYADDPANSNQDHQREFKNGLVGVASVAGITSRNGRISSLNGVKFYPGPGSMSVNGDTYFYPLTVSAQKDGRYASGTVQAYPGYAAASARAGYVPPNFNRQFNNMFFQPPDMFPKNFDPWFPKDVFRYNTPRQDVGAGWLYPSFDPFMNFWR